MKYFIMLLFSLAGIICYTEAQKTCNIAAVFSATSNASPNGRLEIFVGRTRKKADLLGRGEIPGAIYHIWQKDDGTGSWETAWTKYDASPDDNANGLVAGKDAQGRIIVAWISYGLINFLVSEYKGASLVRRGTTFGARYQNESTNTAFKYLTIANNANGLIELLALDEKGRAWSIKQVPQDNQSFPQYWKWENPVYIGGNTMKNISVSQFKDGRLALVATGGNGVVYWTSQTAPSGNWSLTWPRLDGHDIREVHAQESMDHRLEVVALGKDHRLYLKYQFADQSTWSSWSMLRRSTDTKPFLFFEREANGTLFVIAHKSSDNFGNLRQVVPNGYWPNEGQFYGETYNIQGKESEPGIKAISYDNQKRFVIAGISKQNDNTVLLYYQRGVNEPFWLSAQPLIKLPF